MSRSDYHYRKNPNQPKLPFPVLLLFFFLVTAALIFLSRHPSVPEHPDAEKEETILPEQEEDNKKEPSVEEDSESTSGPTGPEQTILLKESDIATFLQGPKAWASKADWSGSWCDKVLAGQKFSVFGCGLCDLANIYSTLTPYICSPLDMYAYAKEVSSYSPSSEHGAIDWPDLQQTLYMTGIISEIRSKDASYEEFQENVSSSLSVIALVSSANDSTYWQDVEGHYVNLWLYSPEDDTVFLADSGNPSHNRQRIPLRYVYDALKTASDYQYLMVTTVSEYSNQWKHDGIDVDWNEPAGL